MTETAVLPVTTRARVALGIARGIAAARGDEDLSPEHVALGLLGEGQNPAVGALHHGGVDLGAIRRELEAELGAPEQPRRGEAALEPTPGEQRILEQAAAESRRRKDEFLGPHHLLLAMLRDTNSPVARTLAHHGFDFETAVTHLRVVLSGGSRPG